MLQSDGGQSGEPLLPVPLCCLASSFPTCEKAEEHGLFLNSSAGITNV